MSGVGRGIYPVTEIYLQNTHKLFGVSEAELKSLALIAPLSAFLVFRPVVLHWRPCCLLCWSFYGSFFVEVEACERVYSRKW